jgi:hypothetical protein
MDRTDSNSYHFLLAYPAARFYNRFTFAGEGAGLLRKFGAGEGVASVQRILRQRKELA